MCIDNGFCDDTWDYCPNCGNPVGANADMLDAEIIQQLEGVSPVISKSKLTIPSINKQK